MLKKMPSFMCESFVIAAERCLVAHNIHIIRLVLNLTSAESVEIIQFVNVFSVFCFCFFENMCIFVILKEFQQQVHISILVSRAGECLIVQFKRNITPLSKALYKFLSDSCVFWICHLVL